MINNSPTEAEKNVFKVFGASSWFMLGIKFGETFSYIPPDEAEKHVRAMIALLKYVPDEPTANFDGRALLRGLREAMYLRTNLSANDKE